MLARLVRYYRLDPERVLALPTYLLRILAQYLPALESAEQLARINAAVAPFLEAGDRADVVRRLEALAGQLAPEAEEAPMEIIREDPAAAAEWFAAMGAKVVSNG